MNIQFIPLLHQYGVAIRMRSTKGYYLSFILFCLMLAGAYLAKQMYTFCQNTRGAEESWCHDLYLVQKIMPFYLVSILQFPQYLEDRGITDYKTALRWLSMGDAINFTTYSPYGRYLPLQLIQETINGVDTYFYRPLIYLEDQLSPVMFYFHGGGGVISSAANFDLACRHLAQLTNITVVCVDYAKSPEVVYPYQQEECLNIVRHVAANGEKYKTDISKIILIGDSFGGNLVNYITFKWRDLGYNEKYAPLLYQVLIYPLLQYVNNQMESHKEYQDTEAFLTFDVLSLMQALHVAGNLSVYEDIRSNCIISYHPNATKLVTDYPELFANVEVTKDKERCKHNLNRNENISLSRISQIMADPYLTGLLHKDFSRLPPALVISPEFDILRDESLLFAQRLSSSGVKAKVHIGKGMFHGFMTMISEYKLYPAAIDAYQEIGRSVQERLAEVGGY